MDLSSTTHPPQILSLQEIAAWQLRFKSTHPAKPKIIVGIPSLQRGAVWKAGQIELLWDSILRGFPLGALVLCRKLPNQGTHSGKHGCSWSTNDVTHHLLDGQQRCNAIALGFVEALEHSVSTSKPPPATLWIDLAPRLSKGTRRFLFRTLTTAHPWGYAKDDNASPLGVPAIREAVNSYGKGCRPSIVESWPHDSNVPIPFSWLASVGIEQGLSGKALWSQVLQQCVAHEKRPWAAAAAQLIRTSSSQHLDLIEDGMHKARAFMVVALEVPQEALQGHNPQEAQTEGGSDDRVHNVEHLFQRLNSAGTELRGEELMFSMIKAYWPSVEESFEAIEDRYGNRAMPMPGSRLAMLGARAALIEGNRLPPAFTIAKIRGLAQDTSPLQSIERERLEAYLGIANVKSAKSAHDSDLHLNLRQIDEWLLFETSNENDFGLPAVLRANLATDAPDVFLLLLYFAQKVRDERLSVAEIAALRKPLLGLSTALTWFGTDQARAVTNLLGSSLVQGKLSKQSFVGVLRSCMPSPDNNIGLLKLPSPCELHTLLPDVIADDQLAEWKIWTGMTKGRDESVVSLFRQHEGPFMWRLLGCKALLLYAQRSYLASQFRDFDPSNIDIWDGHNRPWDYDHILPSAVLNSNHGRFREACRNWSNTIANYRAWPLEKNRSRQDEMASHSIPEYDRPSSYLLIDECEAFSLNRDQISDASLAAGFINAARSRLIRIYQEWYTTLEINTLLSQ